MKIMYSSQSIKCGGDVLKGTDQKGDGFWGSIYKSMEESRWLNLTLRPTTFKSVVVSRWKTINGYVSAWLGHIWRRKGSSGPAAMKKMS